MPTTRPRHYVTETDELAEALDAAAGRMPGLSRSQILVRLALEGERAAERAAAERSAKRLGELRAFSGAFTGTYGEGYLERLRGEWPG